MHGRGSQASAPASNAARCGDAAGTPQTARPCCVGPRRATWQVPNRADTAEVGADSAEIGAEGAKIGPTRSVSACIGRNSRVRPKFKKKKKKVQTHRFTNLKTQTPHISSNTLKQPLSLRPSSPFSVSTLCSVPHLSSLCFGLFV